MLYAQLADATPSRLKRQTDAEWEEAILQGDPTKPSQTLQRHADAGEGDVVMLRRKFSAAVPVEIDVCPQCGGIWLDSDELAQIRR